MIRILFSLFILLLTSCQQNPSNGNEPDLTFRCNWYLDVSREKEFLKYRYYFLDTLYQLAYARKYGPGNNPDVDVTQILTTSFQVWMMTPNKTLASKDISEFRYVRNSPKNNIFKKLDTSAYSLNSDEGWIRFDTTVHDDDIIGIFMEKSDPSLMPQKGDTTLFDSLVYGKFYEMDSLWILKDEYDPTDTTSDGFILMWKNVYRLPNCIDMHAAAGMVTSSGDTVFSYNGNRLSYILGFTDIDGNIIPKSSIYDTENGFLVLPPYTDNPEGLFPFTNPALGDEYISDMNNIYNLNHLSLNFDCIISKYSIFIFGKIF